MKKPTKNQAEFSAILNELEAVKTTASKLGISLTAEVSTPKIIRQTNLDLARSTLSQAREILKRNTPATVEDVSRSTHKPVTDDTDISSGIRAGNPANLPHNGNPANLVHTGNPANLVHTGNPENLAKARAAMTPEQRSAAAKKAYQTRVAQGEDTLAKARAALTPEQRAANLAKARAAMTPEQRSAAARKAAASMTPEERSARGKKAYETRLAREAEKQAQAEAETKPTIETIDINAQMTDRFIQSLQVLSQMTGNQEENWADFLLERFKSYEDRFGSDVLGTFLSSYGELPFIELQYKHIAIKFFEDFLFYLVENDYITPQEHLQINDAFSTYQDDYTQLVDTLDHTVYEFMYNKLNTTEETLAGLTYDAQENLWYNEDFTEVYTKTKKGEIIRVYVDEETAQLYTLENGELVPYEKPY